MASSLTESGFHARTGLGVARLEWDEFIRELLP